MIASLKRKVKKLEEEKKELREQLKFPMKKFIKKSEGTPFPTLFN